MPFNSPPPGLPAHQPGENATKAEKRAWREANAAKQQWFRDMASQGYSFEEAERMYGRAHHGGDPLHGREREHGGVPMRAMWNQWNAYGPGLPLGYTFDWVNGKMRHDATSDEDPNSPTGRYTWQDIPREWMDQRANWDTWRQQNQGKINQSGGDAYAAYLRNWSDFYKPGFQTEQIPDWLGGGGGQYGPYGMQGGGYPPYMMTPSGPMPWGMMGMPGMGYGNQGYGMMSGYGGMDYQKVIGPDGRPVQIANGQPIPPSLDWLYGNMGDVTRELGYQSRLDTLMQMFNQQRQAQEYGEGRGMEKYIRDFYGDILGVEFEDSDYDLGQYMRQGLEDYERSQTFYAGGQGPQGTRPGNPQGPPVRGFEPDGTPSEGQPPAPNGPNPPSPTNPGGGVIRFDADGYGAKSIDDDPDADHSYHPGEEEGGEIPRPDGGGPHAGPLTNPYPYGTPYNGGGQGGAGMPNVPPLPDSGYKLKNMAYDPGRSNTWGMLGRSAQGVANDLDAQREMIKRMMPAGGERNLADSDAINRAFGQIGDMRQSLVSEALSGISNMGQSKKFQVPNLGYTGGGNSLLSNYMQGRGQDITNNLGLSQIRSNERMANRIPWANIFGSVGGGLADLLNDPRKGII